MKWTALTSQLTEHVFYARITETGFIKKIKTQCKKKKEKKSDNTSCGCQTFSVYIYKKKLSMFYAIWDVVLSCIFRNIYVINLYNANVTRSL